VRVMGASWHQLCAAVDEKPGVPLEAFAARAEAVPEGQRIAPRRWALALLAGAAHS
jgi:hypothetical protein